MTNLDFRKQYIIQAIATAANNLRLNSEKIEVVTLLKEYLDRSDDLFSEIQRLKTKTEFSKFAIKLNVLYDYISSNGIDFLKISDKFKEHSHFLVRELSILLDVVTPTYFNELVAEDNEFNEAEESPYSTDVTDGDLPESTENNDVSAEPLISEQDEEKEKFILGDLKTNTTFDFENYLQNILKPIKSFDNFLERVLGGKYKVEELDEYYDLFRQNAVLSQTVGLEIIKKMHQNLYESLRLIREGQLPVNKRNINLIRASMIVIVAIVREKEVDISSFLKKAEILEEILEQKLKETK